MKLLRLVMVIPVALIGFAAMLISELFGLIADTCERAITDGQD